MELPVVLFHHGDIVFSGGIHFHCHQITHGNKRNGQTGEASEHSGNRCLSPWKSFSWPIPHDHQPFDRELVITLTANFAISDSGGIGTGPYSCINAANIMKHNGAV